MRGWFVDVVIFINNIPFRNSDVELLKIFINIEPISIGAFSFGFIVFLKKINLRGEYR